MAKITLIVELVFDGDPAPSSVQQQVYAVLESARKDSQLSEGMGEDVTCDDIIVRFQE